jgi:hypothetical protein
MTRFFLIATALSIAASAEAQSSRQVAIIGCRNAAAKEVRTQRSEADSVRVSPDPQVTEKSEREAEVRGTGQYLDRSRREWRPFIYDCTYNTRSAATAVKVKFVSPSGTP